MQREGKGRRRVARPAASQMHELERMLSASQAAHHLQGWVVKGEEGGEYIIQEKLDEGGMGAIYKALRSGGSETGRIVAVKFVSENMLSNEHMLERFGRETDALKKIGHPNVIRILDSGEIYERSVRKPFLVMEYIEGEDLQTVLSRKKRLIWDEARPLLLGIASGLVEAHKLGIVHRDLKPANIRLDSTTGNPVILDFGIAKDFSSEDKLTVTGIAMGTPDFMSPEQAQGSKDLDARADVYSFCALAYYMLTGTPLFLDGNPFDIAMKQINEDPVPPTQRIKGLDIPKDVEETIMKGLRKNPAERHQTMDELREALQRSSGSRHPFLSPQEFDKKGFMGHGRRFPIPSIAMAAAAVAVICASTVFILRSMLISPSERPEPALIVRRDAGPPDAQRKDMMPPDAAAPDIIDLGLPSDAVQESRVSDGCPDTGDKGNEGHVEDTMPIRATPGPRKELPP